MASATPDTADSTYFLLLSMPFASPCMKSGIQLSKSARGPSSGTEKCRKDLILFATPFTASATLLIQPLMPFTIPLIISAPHEKASDARFLMKLTAALNPLTIVVLIAVIFWDTADFTFSQIFETVVLMAFITLDTVFLMLFQIFATVAKIVFRILLTKPLIAFQIRKVLLQANGRRTVQPLLGTGCAQKRVYIRHPITSGQS